MKNKISQISVEYLIIFGILLISLVVIVLYFIQTVPEEIKLKQANDAVNKIVKTIDTVYSIGPGARRIIYVNFPSGVDHVNITSFPGKTGGEVSLKLTYRGNLIDIIAVTKANITGEIPPGTIGYKLYIETTEDRFVNITSQ